MRTVLSGVFVAALLSAFAPLSWGGVIPKLQCNVTADTDAWDAGENVEGSTNGVVWACQAEVASYLLVVSTEPGDPDGAPSFDAFEGPAPLEGNSGVAIQDDTWLVPDCFAGEAEAIGAHAGTQTDADSDCVF